MELWLILALSFAFLHALVAVFDRRILKDARIDALALSAIRFSINAIFAFIFVLLLAVPLAPGIGYEALSLSLLYFLAAATYFYALKSGDVSKLIPYRDAIVVLLSFFLAVAILSEKFVPRDFIGALVIVIGGYVVWTDGRVSIPKKSPGLALIAASAVFVSLNSIAAKTALASIHPLALSFLMYALVALYFAVAIAVSGRARMNETMRAIFTEKKLAAFTFAASFAAVFGTSLQFYALSMQNAAKVLPVAGTLPLFAALIGWLALKEKHGAARIIGAGLLVMGIYILQT